MAQHETAPENLLRLIIQEVDEAQDILQLAEQLQPLLPIRSFDALIKAGEAKEFRFRDMSFDVSTLKAHIPSVIFPIEDVRGLVERLGHLLRLVPEHLGVDLESESGARRQRRHDRQLVPGLGLSMGPSLTAIVRDSRTQPQPIPERGSSPETG